MGALGRKRVLHVPYPFLSQLAIWTSYQFYTPGPVEVVIYNVLGQLTQLRRQ